MGLPGLCFGEPHLAKLRVREAAAWTHAVPDRHRRPPHGVGRRHEAVLDRLWDKHEAAGNVASGEDVRCRGPQRSEEHTSELQSRQYLVCRLLLETKKIEREQ